MKRGRKALPEHTRRGVIFNLRVTAAEQAIIDAAAAAAGLLPSEWARRRLLSHADADKAVELAGIEPAGTSGVGALPGPV